MVTDKDDKKKVKVNHIELDETKLSPQFKKVVDEHEENKVKKQQKKMKFVKKMNYEKNKD